jgi:predicted RNA-binding Zn-ribbon protein involved in translation (DUF1610 family)
MLRVSVADVEVKYRQVEVPEACPMCGAALEARGEDGLGAVRELNLASTNFFGAFGRTDGEGFVVDPEGGEEHPSDAVWVVFGYECARCGELLASGAVDVS